MYDVEGFEIFGFFRIGCFEMFEFMMSLSCVGIEK